MLVDLPHIMSRTEGKEIEITIAGTLGTLAKNDMIEVETTDVDLDLALLLLELLYSLLPMFLVLSNLLDTSQLLSLLDPSPTIPGLRQCPQ